MNERTISSRAVFKGWLLQVESLEVELDSGVRSVREVVRHPGAACVLARTPDGSFVFVRQYRKAVEGVVIEVVAGCLEQGELPEECARREMMEETGYSVESISKLGRIWPSPGYTDEVVHVFLAETGKAASRAEPEHDEDIGVVHLALGQIEEMIERGEIEDAKTLAAWCLYRTKRAAELKR